MPFNEPGSDSTPVSGSGTGGRSMSFKPQEPSETNLATELYISIDLITSFQKDSPGYLNQPLQLFADGPPLHLRVTYHGALSFFKFMIRSFFRSRPIEPTYRILIESDRPLVWKSPISTLSEFRGA